ncbi:uncharacterized protein LOC144342906 [Saccoglossus kowalevskii]
MVDEPTGMKLKLFVAFGFYEKVNPSESDLQIFETGFRHAADNLKKHKQFISGVLCKNLEANGKYAYLNYAVFNTYEQNGLFIHDEFWTNLVLEGQGRHVINHHSGFAEKFLIANTHIKPLPKIPQTDRTIYMIVCNQIEESIDIKQVEKTWKSWTGTEYIHRQQVCRELGLRSITFHLRLSKNGKYNYVTRFEFTNLGNQLGWGFSFMDDIRELKLPTGMTLHVSLYKPHYIYAK